MVAKILANDFDPEATKLIGMNLSEELNGVTVDKEITTMDAVDLMY